MKVKKHTLLLIACLVWVIAGINILKIGVLTYLNYVSLVNIILSIVVFSLFWFLIFKKLVVFHTDRIKNFNEEPVFFLKFFDKKSFIIMFVMMTFGILIRKLNLAPDRFIAFFYTGLGFALFLAGIFFGYNYFKYFPRDDKFEANNTRSLINISFIYFILAMASGVFYREFTKILEFTGKTTLAFAHIHLIALGTLLFLILYLFALNTNLLEQKRFKYFLKVYNIALPFMVIMFIVRGTLQVLNEDISKSIDASISGIAGISHILILFAFILLFLSLKNISIKG